MRSLSLPLALLRLLGGFPYLEVKTEIVEEAWRAEQEKEGTITDQTPQSYKKSIVWFLWSCLLWILVLVTAGETAFELFHGLRGEYIFTFTLVVASKFTQITHFISVVCLVGYLAFKMSSAVSLVCELQTLQPPRPRPHKILLRNLLMTLILLVFLAGHLILIAVLTPSLISEPRLTSISYIFKLLLLFVLQLFAMLFYFDSISLMGNAYDDIISFLSEFHNKRARTPVCLDRVGASVSPSVMEEHQYRNPSTALVHLHHLLRLLHRYMGFPIALITLLSVVSTILSWFYFAFWSDPDVNLKLLTIGHLISGVVPPLALCNIPEILRSRVSELEIILCSLKRSKLDERSKEQITETQEVLKEFPGFELCGMFTLGRARLVDIYSFMATYFIILLQFQVSEEHD